MNLNDMIYNAFRKVPEVTDEQAQKAAGEFTRLESDTQREFNSLDKRMIKLETKLDGLTRVSIGFHLITLAGIVGLFLKGSP